MLPLTIGYIGGSSREGGRSGGALLADAASFAAGLATTLAALGVLASLAGKAYGQVGPSRASVHAASLLARSRNAHVLTRRLTRLHATRL